MINKDVFMKSIIAIIMMLSAISSFATCPELQGRYNKCYSEIRPIKGEYLVDQHLENDYEIYNVQYNDDESGDSRSDVFKTNNQKESRKTIIPRSSISVRVDSKSRCEGSAVIADADVFFLGAKVGSFTSKIYLEGKQLKSNLDGAYLGKDVHKRIVCEIE